MKNLSIATIGIKGGDAKQQKTGYVSVYSGNDLILSVDNFRGSGETYQQLPEPSIIIRSDNWTVIFEGTHEQLINRLK